MTPVAALSRLVVAFFVFAAIRASGSGPKHSRASRSDQERPRHVPAEHPAQLPAQLKNFPTPRAACFAPIDTHGESSLYRQMFLSPSQLDDAFAEDGYGKYFTKAGEKLMDHAVTLRAAFSLTASELNEIMVALSPLGEVGHGKVRVAGPDVHRKPSDDWGDERAYAPGHPEPGGPR
jgi:hypothetical protein